MLIILLLTQISLCFPLDTEVAKLYSGSMAGYLSIPQTMKLLAQWTAKNPELIVPPFQIGRSHQNNPILMFGITNLPNKSPQNLKHHPGILLTSLIHPRERGSLTMLLATFLQILNLSHKSDRMNYLLDTSVVWFVPFVNLDGVMYVERLWENGHRKLDEGMEYRKNRQVAAVRCQDEIHVGVDLNRNFQAHFGILGVKNPCSEQYPGDRAFSEKQSQTIRTIFSLYPLTLAIDIHTYGNTWVYPYSYDTSGQALKHNQTQYSFYKHIKNHFEKLGLKIDNCYNTLGYIADGVYIDWALDNKVLSFAYEVGNQFSQPQQTLQLSINYSMPSMMYMLMKNSYSVDPVCVEGGKETVEYVLRSNSLVELRMEVQGLLYWKKDNVVGNSTEVVIPALGNVRLGFRLNTKKTVMQLTVKKNLTGTSSKETSKDSGLDIYTEQIIFPDTLPICESSLGGLSDNIIIGIVIALFFVCLFGCIVLSCVQPLQQKPNIKYNVVDPESMQSV